MLQTRDAVGRVQQRYTRPRARDPILFDEDTICQTRKQNRAVPCFRSTSATEGTKKSANLRVCFDGVSGIHGTHRHYRDPQVVGYGLDKLQRQTLLASTARHELIDLIDNQYLCGCEVRAQVEGGSDLLCPPRRTGKYLSGEWSSWVVESHDYRPIRMNEMLPAEVIILTSREAPGGAGNEAISPFAPTLAYAL